MKFVYVIFDVHTHHIFAIYKSERECIEAFTKFYKGFANVDWCGLNLKHCLESVFSK